MPKSINRIIIFSFGLIAFIWLATYTGNKIINRDFYKSCEPKGPDYDVSEKAVASINNKLAKMYPSVKVAEIKFTDYKVAGTIYDSFEDHYYTVTTTDGRVAESHITIGCHGTPGNYTESKFDINLEHGDLYFTGDHKSDGS